MMVRRRQVVALLVAALCVLSGTACLAVFREWGQFEAKGEVK